MQSFAFLVTYARLLLPRPMEWLSIQAHLAQQLSQPLHCHIIDCFTTYLKPNLCALRAYC